MLKCLYENATISGPGHGTYPLATGCETGRSQLSETVHSCSGGCLEGSGLERAGLNADGEYISHLPCADDIVVMSDSMEYLSTMLDNLSRASESVGLKIIMHKTRS